MNDHDRRPVTTIAPDTDAERHVRPFADWLTQQRKGVLNIEAGASLNQLVEAVREVGRGGTLTITVKVNPGKGSSLEVVDDVKVKLPEHDREAALWFADREHNLTRRDPEQPEMPFPRAVPDGVDPTTGEVAQEATTP